MSKKIPSSTKVVVIGGGVVGTQAAKMLSGLGADVTILDISLERLRELDDIMPENVKTKFSSHYNIKKEIKEHICVIEDNVVKIKLNEVIFQLDKTTEGKVVKDSQVSTLLMSYELIKELKKHANEKK